MIPSMYPARSYGGIVMWYLIPDYWIVAYVDSRVPVEIGELMLGIEGDDE